MIRSQETRRKASAALRILGVAAAYYGAGEIGLLRRVTIHGATVTPLWPSTGIAVGCLLYLGIGIWPGITLGSLVSSATLADSLTLSDFGVVAGNTLAPVCSYLMLRRFGFRIELDRLRDGVVLVFLGAMAGMLISATVGTVLFVLDDKLPVRHFWPVWAAYWAGDAMGVLVVTPVLLVLRKARLPRADDRWLEATALAVASVGIGLLATRSELSLFYLVFPLLIWAALRFQLAGSAPVALLVSVLAILSGTESVGPFAGHTLLEVMLNLAIFNGSVALTALLLSAIVTESMNVRRRIEQACDDLAEVVDQLAPGRSAATWPSRYEDRRNSHGP
ncbi:MASE1 domain-containing protein [Streptomyces sp. NPDC005318]|uniref:MASE1 domain-containing protein n=1 Tax=Streptomyces sp. NPDC005318 TaxID=3157031 RepID=UPI0033B1FC1F